MTEKLRLLVVEDSEDDLLLLVADLKKAGFDVEHERVETADEMTAALARGPWHLVVSDFRMPHFDAPGAIRTLEKSGLDIPLVIVSGTIGEDAAVQALKAGAQDFFVKGRLARLAPAIRRELADAEARRAHRRAEDALRASEARFRQMAENIGEVFWLSDPRRTEMLYVSPAYETIWGRPFTDGAAWMEAVHPDDRGRAKTASSQIHAAGRYDETYRVVRPDGAIRWVRDRAYPVRDGSGTTRRVVGIAGDVTALKEAEAALRSSEEQLRQSQKMEAVGRLAGGIAHDFNNLLTVIEGYGNMTLAGLRPEDPLHGYVDEIRRASERAAALTRQLLAFSRKQVLQPQVLDLNEVVAAMDRMLRRLIGEDVTLVKKERPRLGRVSADPGQVEQVIVNLAVNARDAMPRGGTLTLETLETDLDAEYVRRHAGLAPGRYVCLAVSDTGTGMDAETLRHMFEPFFTTKEPGKGTGLGLSTVYGIVKQSSGHVSVYSEVGRGSTFKVYLPRIDPRVTQPTRTTSISTPRAPTHGAETVLLAEDETAVRSLVRRVLEQAGYTVIEAKSGDEALTVLRDRSRKVDLLLTDVVMPGWSGPGIGELLSRVGGAPRVLYMSGYTDAAVVNQGVVGPDTPFLQKPFTPEALLRRVRETLDAT